MKEDPVHQLSSKLSIVAGFGLVLLVGLFLLTCSKKERSNPLDPSNPSAGGNPLGLSVNMIDQGVELQWKALAMSRLASYRIYCGRTSNGIGGNPIVIPKNRTRWVDTTCWCDSAYYYRLTAVDDNGGENEPGQAQSIKVDSAKLCVSLTTWPAPVTGGTSQAINVTNCGKYSKFGWSVSENAGWLSALSNQNTQAGETPGSFTLRAEPNYSGATRSADITIRANATGVNESAKTLTVTQQSGAILCVDSSSWTAPTSGGTSPLIGVRNCGNGVRFSYSISETESWLSLSQTGGQTAGSFTITATENSTGNTRQGTVTVSATTNGVSGSPRTITVTQFGVIPVFSDDFESYVVGQAPTTNGWYYVSRYPSQATITASGYSGKGVLFSDPTDDLTDSSYAEIYRDDTGLRMSSCTFVFKSTGTRTSWGIQSYANGTSDFYSRVALLFEVLGTSMRFNGAMLTQTVVVGAWYNVKIDLDFETRSCKLYLNGILLDTQGFYGTEGGTDAIRLIEYEDPGIITNGTTNGIIVDNLSVYGVYQSLSSQVSDSSGAASPIVTRPFSAGSQETQIRPTSRPEAKSDR